MRDIVLAQHGINWRDGKSSCFPRPGIRLDLHITPILHVKDCKLLHRRGLAVLTSYDIFLEPRVNFQLREIVEGFLFSVLRVDLDVLIRIIIRADCVLVAEKNNFWWRLDHIIVIEKRMSCQHSTDIPSHKLLLGFGLRCLRLGIPEGPRQLSRVVFCLFLAVFLAVADVILVSYKLVHLSCSFSQLRW